MGEKNPLPFSKWSKNRKCLFIQEKKDCRSFTIIPLFEIKQQILPPFSERAIFCPQAFTEKAILGFTYPLEFVTCDD